ncbi:ABC transporter substrate-binding protein [Rhizobium grahamii]|uniref:ABC transporter substrate-binding protein n=2 Tax=Rhizobium grahamii TaxID=1120045 RepID=S3HF49_9HYPH|nr:ABC transporter substrate-binding protein [Rhizobium grahamii]EPE96705.1 ABC transporter substrate-binding protein [Rhizobium grahamii CCGE 502]RDJ03932.1 ABC transporter substrate-binding protein [Rhizobium grahamii]
MKRMHLVISAALLSLVATAASAESNLKLLKDGEIRILSNPIYPPMEYVNPETGVIDGFDVDLANAIAKKLNLTTVFVPAAFQQLQSGLQTGRADMIISGMSDNTKRQASMDFVDYLTSGPILFTVNASADKYKVATDLCGKSVAGSRSTTFGENVKDWSAANCEAKGKPAIKFDGTEDSNAARLGMKQGRYDAVVQGIETIAYQMKIEPNTYTLVGDPLLSNDVFGMAFKKDNTGLRDAVASALDALIKDGTYDELLKKWGLVHNAVPKAVVNGVK